MPFEPSRELDTLAHKVIGAAIEVHRPLGPGFLEALYEEALSVEFDLQNISYLRQHCIGVQYKNRIVGEGKLDFFVDRCLVVELKAVDMLHPIHTAQVLSYLKTTGCRLGLLINFNEVILKNGIKRVVFNK